MKSIDPDSPTHKWHQLKTLLLRRIEDNDYDPNEVFCNQQELMDKYGLSYATVARSLSELVREGYLYRKRGVGTFVRPKVERRGARGSIGMLVWDREHILEHPAYSRLVAGLIHPLRAAGHNLSFIFANEQLICAGKLPEIVRRANVTALVAPFQPKLTEAHLQPLADDGLPIVPLNLDVPHVSPCAVHFDIAEAVEQATHHLFDCGYAQVALMVPENEEAAWRSSGYRRALEKRGMRDQVVFTELAGQPLRPEVQRVLKGLKPPAGLVASDDIAALTALRAAQEAGWSVPDQLGIVGVGDVLPPDVFEAPLTTIHVPFDEMGRLAAEMTLDLLAGRTPTPAVRNLAPRLVVRATTTHLTKSALQRPGKRATASMPRQ